MKYIIIVLLAGLSSLFYIVSCSNDINKNEEFYNISVNKDMQKKIYEKLRTYESDIDELVFRTNTAFFDNRDFLEKLPKNGTIIINFPENIKNSIFDNTLRDTNILECIIEREGITSFYISKANWIDSLAYGTHCFVHREIEYGKEDIRRNEEQYYQFERQLYLFPRDPNAKIFLPEVIPKDRIIRKIEDIGTFKKRVFFKNGVFVDVRLFVDLSNLISELKDKESDNSTSISM